MAYSLIQVIFIETPIFTAQISGLLPDEDYHAFQIALALRPDSGDLIKGTGGLRKIRWARPGTGKSGGIRVIYYLVHNEEIFLLCAYPKSKQETLTPAQAETLARLVSQHLKS